MSFSLSEGNKFHKTRRCSHICHRFYYDLVLFLSCMALKEHTRKDLESKFRNIYALIKKNRLISDIAWLNTFHYFLFWALHTCLSICVKFNRPWCSHACLLFVIVRKFSGLIRHWSESPIKTNINIGPDVRLKKNVMFNWPLFQLPPAIIY
jgi:hypothetical protein